AEHSLCRRDIRRPGSGHTIVVRAIAQRDVARAVPNVEHAHCPGGLDVLHAVAAVATDSTEAGQLWVWRLNGIASKWKMRRAFVRAEYGEPGGAGRAAAVDIAQRLTAFHAPRGGARLIPADRVRSAVPVAVTSRHRTGRRGCLGQRHCATALPQHDERTGVSTRRLHLEQLQLFDKEVMLVAVA